MSSVKLPYFGHIDPSALEEYYDAEVPYNDTEIMVDLNFETGTIDPARLDLVKNFIDNIRIHDINNKKLIAADYDDEQGDTVKEYIEHHLEELGEEELSGLVDVNAKAADKEKQMLQKLNLVRVGLYPDSADQFAIFDYSIGEDITNYLVVLFTDENGNLDYMTLES